MINNRRFITFTGNVEPIKRYALTSLLCTTHDCIKQAVYGTQHCLQHTKSCLACTKLASPYSDFCVEHKQ